MYNSDFAVAHVCESSIKSHAKGETHKKLVKEKDNAINPRQLYSLPG